MPTMPGATPADRAAARAFTNGALNPDMTKLTTALDQLYGDGYVAGQMVAAQQTGATVVAGLGQTLPVGPAEWATFWDAWTPGNQPAADLLSNGGLAQLLARTEVTVKGIEGTTLDRLGNLLADGVAQGLSVDSIARNMGDFIDDPDRAYLIADTEMARSVCQASADQYAASGVTQWDWLASPGACPECEDYASGGPYDVGDGPDLPGHPRCRCSSSPVDSGVAAESDGS